MKGTTHLIENNIQHLTSSTHLNRYLSLIKKGYPRENKNFFMCARQNTATLRILFHFLEQTSAVLLL